MQVLRSFLSGRWIEGSGATQILVNPATEDPLATASSGGIDLAAALGYARDTGGPGRAGDGEELGGRRALSFYLQRVALEGSRPVIAGLAKGGTAS